MRTMFPEALATADHHAKAAVAALRRAYSDTCTCEARKPIPELLETIAGKYLFALIAEAQTLADKTAALGLAAQTAINRSPITETRQPLPSLAQAIAAIAALVDAIDADEALKSDEHGDGPALAHARAIIAEATSEQVPP